MIRLRNLVESLEKKYDLNESTTINEKFSDNVPDWFAKRVLTTKYAVSGRPRKRDMGGKAHFPGESEFDYVTSGKGSKKNPHAGKDPEYKQSDYWSGDQSLFTKLMQRGISLDTVNVIEGPVPKNSSDARVQSPNIPILLFDNGVVYIPGMNDDEKLGGRKTLGAYDLDVLLGRCVKFAYIDGNDPNNFKVSEKRNIRRSSELPDKNFYRYGDKRVDRNGDPIGDLGSWRTDKSGYHKIPPIERYRDQLNKIKATKIFDILQDVEDTLVDLQQEFSYYISSSSIKDYDYGSFDIINIRLDRAVNAYKAVYKNVEQIMNDQSLTDERKKEVLVNLVNGNYPYGGNGGLPHLNTKMSELKEVTNDKFNATIDWI